MKYLAILILLLSPIADAAEFEPYPVSEVSIEEWEAYFNQIKLEYGDSARRDSLDEFIFFYDDEAVTMYQFTTESHPAHPCWITNEIEMGEGTVKVNQIGFFAGSKLEFDKLYNEIREINDLGVRNSNRVQQ